MSAEGPVALVVLCTVPSAEVAERLARGLLDERLVACVNVLPGLTSYYRWEGAIHADSELLLVIKSTRERFESLREWLAREHPYDVPEILALAPEAVHAPYLAWLAVETGAAATPG